MKKKLTVLFLASVLALSAVACNNGSSTTESKVESAKGTSSVASATESKTESKVDESTASETPSTANSDVDVKQLLQKNFIDIVNDGKYYMQISMDTSSLISGSETSALPENLTMVIAADIENQKMYVDLGYQLMGFQRVVITEGKQWMFDDTNKIAYYQATTDDIQKTLDSMTSSMLSSTSANNMTYVSDSIETFDGKECYAVVYKVASDVSLAEGVSLASSSGLETEQTYYFDKSTNALMGIKVKNSSVESEIVVKSLTNDIPVDTFTIPSDYKKTALVNSSMMGTTSNS